MLRTPTESLNHPKEMRERLEGGLIAKMKSLGDFNRRDFHAIQKCV